MLKVNNLKIPALTLTTIGALNWGLVGVFGFDLVAGLFGKMTLLSRLVYILVGLSGITLITEYWIVIKRYWREHHHTAGTI